MNNEFVTIKEFSKMAGVSYQAIHKRLSTDLQPFIQPDEGRKMLNVKALSLFVLNQDYNQNTTVEKNIQPVEKDFKPVENNFKPVENTVENELIKTLQETISVLNNQLTVKDNQITELNDRLRESLELNRNNQVLIGMEKKSLLQRLFPRKEK